MMTVVTMDGGLALDSGSILEVVCAASRHGRCHCGYSQLSPRKPRDLRHSRNLAVDLMKERVSVKLDRAFARDGSVSLAVYPSVHLYPVREVYSACRPSTGCATVVGRCYLRRDGSGAAVAEQRRPVSFHSSIAAHNGAVTDLGRYMLALHYCARRILVPGMKIETWSTEILSSST